MLRRLLIAVTLGVASPVLAHPHVFVDAEVTIVLDPSGAVAGVALTWIYDDFFSLLLTSEIGIDADGDMVLAAQEEAALAAYVLDWPSDFGGDLFVWQNGAALPLAPRANAVVAFVDGRVRESHFRPLAQPVMPDAPVQVQVYDPFYYVAYDVQGNIGLAGGEGCRVLLQKADLNAAYALVDELLYGRPASDFGPDEAFPEVGHAFADTVTLTCSG